MRTEVCIGDLTQLDVVHRILALLNDAAASSSALGALVDEMPVLRARLNARFRQRFDRSTTSAHELATLGNRAFEEVLLALLEDLTELRASMLDLHKID